MPLEFFVIERMIFMKKKNILICCLISFALFMGFTNVEAKTIYTAYESGDKITANVNSDTQVDFFVVEDSSSNSDKVLALTYDFVSDDKCSFSEAQTLLNTTKTNWSNAISINIPTSLQLVGQTVELEDEFASNKFTSPSWVSPKTSDFVEYWLSDVPFEGSHSVVWGMDTYYNTEFHIAPKEDTEEAYVKLIIEIAKENVVGGTYISEDETLWDKFIEEFKNTEIFKTMEEPETNTVDIESTSDSLKVVLSIGTNSWTTNFKYANGIITYVPSDNDEDISIDGIWSLNCLYALSNIKGYDFEKVSNWLKEDRQFTLATDGIEFEIKDVIEEINSSEAHGIGTVTTYSSFKLDIKNGLKTFSNEEDKKDEVAENPKTGNYYSYGILCAVALIGGSSYLVIRKRSKFPKSN